MANKRSVRADILMRRTYNRPLNDEGTIFETNAQTLDRVIGHQRWLWERQLGDKLNKVQEHELSELKEVMEARQVCVAGRTLWLGGTELVKRRELSSFNCAFLEIRTIHDVVDAFWGLLNGSGVGFKVVSGTLSGFTRNMEVQIIRSVRTEKGGKEENDEHYDQPTKTWTISVGDAAESWAKSVGKILAGKYPARKLVLDFRQIRPAGTRLKGYGWICSGDAQLADAYKAICDIMNKQAGKLLSKENIWHIVNWLGTVLSTRRSAQIGLIDYGDKEWRTIATMKNPKNMAGNGWFLSQSNNSIMFYEKPPKRVIKEIFEMMVDNMGSEPGFINMAAALNRAIWAKGVNPCAEILLSSQNTCNLVELDVSRFKNNTIGMHRAMILIARANYRQTCVNLRDGVLQDAWHQNNEYLRLCGAGLTGITCRPDMTPYDYRQLRYTAISAAYNMADELELERPKNVTCVKPSGCRPANALTITTNGILTLDELFVDHEDGKEWCNYKEQNSALRVFGETKPITKTYVNGDAQTLRVKLSYGLTVESTLDHPWWVIKHHRYGITYTDINQWVKAKDISVGDVLDVVPGVYQSTKHSKLIPLNTLAIKMRGDSVDILQPEYMSPDLAWFLGYLWGDGAQSPGGYRVRFTDAVEANILKAIDILKRLFGLTAQMHPASGGKKCFVLEVGSVQLWHWLIRNDIYKYFANNIDRIPRCVRASSTEDILAFISGLIDADGCCSAGGVKTTKSLTLTTSNKRFAEHVQHVAWSVGLCLGCSLNSAGTNFQTHKNMYLMGMASVTTHEAFAAILRNSNKVAATDKRSDLRWVCHGAKHARGVIGKVTDIEDGGIKPTYDIEVADDHWYYAGAVKSHNTLSKAWFDTTEGAHKPKARHIINTVEFSAFDPLVKLLEQAGYWVIPHPTKTDAVLGALPVHYPDVPLDNVNGYEVDNESALDQMRRYEMLQTNYVDQNTSITISYEPNEVKGMVDRIDKNWDNYVACSFLFRDKLPTGGQNIHDLESFKTAMSEAAGKLGYSYLPQMVVTGDVHDNYLAKLKDVNIDNVKEGVIVDELDKECAGGACPIR